MNKAEGERDLTGPVQPDDAHARVMAQQLEQQWFALLSGEEPATLEQVQEIWRKRPGLLNLKDRKNRNALYYAIMTGKVEIVAWLVAHDRHKPSKPTEALLAGVMDDLASRLKATCQAIERYLQGQPAAALEEFRRHFAAKPSLVPSPDAMLMKYAVAGELPHPTHAPGVPPNGFMEGGVHTCKRSGSERNYEGLVFEYLLVTSGMDMEVATARDNEVFGDRTGMIAKKAFRQAFDYYQQAAESGNAEAQFCAAVMHEDMDSVYDNQMEYWDEDVVFGIETDAEQAMALYAKAAAQGHPEACLRLATHWGDD